MSTSTKKIALPSVLAFERKLESSDGLMLSGNWCDKESSDCDNKWQAIPIITRQNRSTQSASGIDVSKKIMPNPVSSDSDDATLPLTSDTLKLSFTLRVIGNVGQTFACNSPIFATAIGDRVHAFKSSQSMEELAYRYAYNIVNARFLWRNRVGAEEVEVQVILNGEEEKLVFNAYDFSLNNFDKNRDNEVLEKLANAIKKGFVSDEECSFVFMKVDAFVKLGQGQHVFPSQEMNMGEKKKRLFKLDGCAAMHNVKVGNALRTIDTWYGNTMLVRAEGKGKTATVDIESGVKKPIAIEPYGAVTQHGRAYRDKKIDLYTLMIAWSNNEDIGHEQEGFVVANLIRGGVFGGDSE